MPPTPDPADRPPPVVRVGRRAVSNLAFGMAWLAFMVVALDLWLNLLQALPSAPLRRVFDATSERGLGSWVSVTQTGLIALTLAAMAAVYRGLGEPRRRWGAWAALAVFFGYLAFDDATMFHERVGTAVAEASDGGGRLGAFPSYYWQVVFGPPLAVAGALMAAFLWRELRAPRHRALVGAAFGLLGLAVGLDFVDGLGPDHPLNAYAWVAGAEGLDARTRAWFDLGAYDSVVHLSRAVEESLEMGAMTALWSAFLLHFGATVPALSVRWAGPEAAAPPTRRRVARRAARRTGRRGRAFSPSTPRAHAAPDA